MSNVTMVEWPKESLSDGFKGSLVRVANEDGRQVVVEDDEKKVEVLPPQFSQLNLVIRSVGWLREAGKDALQKWSQERVEHVENFRLESKHDLLDESEECGHLVLGRAWR